MAWWAAEFFPQIWPLVVEANGYNCRFHHAVRYVSVARTEWFQQRCYVENALKSGNLASKYARQERGTKISTEIKKKKKL